MSCKISKNASKMYHFLSKNSNFPAIRNFPIYSIHFLKNLPEIEEKSPRFLFQTYHMYVCVCACACMYANACGNMNCFFSSHLNSQLLKMFYIMRQITG